MWTGQLHSKALVSNIIHDEKKCDHAAAGVTDGSTHKFGSVTNKLTESLSQFLSKLSVSANSANS